MTSETPPKSVPDRPAVPTLITPPSANGHSTAAEDQAQAAAVDAVYQNYSRFAGQIGALATLIGNQPLPLLLAACKRAQSSALLTLPANATAEYAHQLRVGLRNDQKLFEALINVQRVMQQIASGQ